MQLQQYEFRYQPTLALVPHLIGIDIKVKKKSENDRCEIQR